MMDQNLKRRMELMSPRDLKQFAMMHKNDPFVVSMAVDIDNSRKAAQRQQAMQAGAAAQGQPPVVDSALYSMGMPEGGIPVLPAQNMEGMADGGIAGYAEGGKTETKETYRAYAMRKAREMGLDPNFVDKIFEIESGYDPKAKSKTGPQGIGQLTSYIAKRFGINPKERTDPYKNIDASIGFMDYLNKKYKGDPAKIAVAYNQGEPVLDAHLKRNKGQLVPETLHEDVRTANKQEPAKYLEKMAPVLAQGTREAPRTPEMLARQQEAIRRRKLTEALPISSAQAADETARTGPYVRGSNRSISGPVTRADSVRDVGMTFPPSMLNPALNQTSPAAARSAPEEVIYSPDGIPLTTPVSSGYPQTSSPVAAQLAGLVDIVPKALYGIGRTASENVLALPFGREVPTEKRRETAEKIMSPFYRYGTVGGLTGLARDPAYGTDPVTQALEKVVQANLEKSDEAIAAMTGANPENVRLVRENLLLAAPSVAKIKAPESTMPKLPGKGKPSVTAAKAAEDAALAERAAAEAKAKVSAPRLAAPAEEAPGVMRVTREGEAIPPTGAAAASERAGLAGLADDLNAARAAEQTAARARATAAAAQKAETQAAGMANLRDRAGKVGLTTAGLSAAGAGLRFPEDALITPPEKRPYEAWEPDFVDRDRTFESKLETKPEEKAAPAAEAPAAKKTGLGALTDEDWLTMGLNMLQAPAGQPGGALSQLASNIGRSGLATLGEKRAREQRELDQAYKQTMEGYYKGLTGQLGRPGEDERIIQQIMKDKNVTFTEALRLLNEMKYAPQAASRLAVAEMNPQLQLLRQYGLLDDSGGLTPRGQDVFSNPKTAEYLKQYGG